MKTLSPWLDVLAMGLSEQVKAPSPLQSLLRVLRFEIKGETQEIHMSMVDEFSRSGGHCPTCRRQRGPGAGNGPSTRLTMVIE